MMALRDLSSQELVKEIERRANEVKANDASLGVTLGGLLRTVGELAKRLDDDDE